MIILGIDPGLAHTGWGVIETRGTQCKARAYGCITTTSHEPLDQRLGAIYQGIADAISRFVPSQLACEKIFFGENTASAIATAHARGAAIVAAAQAGVVLGEYTPMQIKQAVVGTGAADKRQVIFMVRTILGLDHDPRPDHCADALAAAICHVHMGRTVQLAYKSSAAQMLEQMQAQAEADAQRARAKTQAATEAHSAYAKGLGNIMNKTRQSRRNSS